MIWLQTSLAGSVFSCTYTKHVECTGWNVNHKSGCEDIE